MKGFKEGSPIIKWTSPEDDFGQCIYVNWRWAMCVCLCGQKGEVAVDEVEYKEGLQKQFGTGDEPNG